MEGGGCTEWIFIDECDWRVRIDLMEGGGCTEWIFIDECDWRVIVRV